MSTSTDRKNVEFSLGYFCAECRGYYLAAAAIAAIWSRVESGSLSYSVFLSLQTAIRGRFDVIPSNPECWEDGHFRFSTRHPILKSLALHALHRFVHSVRKFTEAVEKFLVRFQEEHST